MITLERSVVTMADKNGPRHVSPLNYLLGSLHTGVAHVFSFLTATDRGMLYAVDTRTRRLVGRQQIPPWCMLRPGLNCDVGGQLRKYLCAAARDGHVGAVRHMSDAMRDVTDERLASYFGIVTPIFLEEACSSAAKEGQVDCMRFILGVIDHPPKDIVVDAACDERCLRTVVEEFGMGVDVDVVKASARSGRVACLSFALERFDGVMSDSDRQKVALAAVHGGSVECARYLEDNGFGFAKVYIVHGSKGSAGVDMVSFLRARGWTPCVQDVEFIASAGRLETLRSVIESTGVSCSSIVNAAARAGKMDCLRYLVEQRGMEVLRAVHDAAAGGSVEVLAYLTDRGSKVCAQDVLVAAKHGHAEALRFMVERCDAECGGHIVETACRHGQLAVLRYLVEEKGVPLTVDAAATMAENNHLECLRHFVESEVIRPHNRVVFGAIKSSNASCLRYLLDHNFPVDLHVANLAAEGNRVDALDIMMRRDVQIGKETLLHAICYGAFDSVRLLLERGVGCSMEEAEEASRTFTLGPTHESQTQLCLTFVRQACGAK